MVCKNEYEIANCLHDSGENRILVVKSRNADEQFLMKLSHVKDHNSLIVKTRRFKRELEVVSLLDHPNISKPVSTESSATSLSIIYAYHKGSVLNKYLNAGINFSISECLKIVIQILDALEYLHMRGIVHCDINPLTIFLKEDRGVEIFDFNLSMTEDEAAKCLDGIVTGTFPYVSPEQTGFTGIKIDTRSDLYCAGMILYRLLAGRLPFLTKSENTEELLDLMLKTEPEPIRTVPVYVNEILLKSLRATPDERYQTAGGFKYDLKIALEILENVASAGNFVSGERDAVIAVYSSRYFIAREREVDALRDGFTSLQQKESVSFLLTGVSGIGKSTIVRSFTSSAEISDAFIMIAKCNRLTSGQPYAALRNLLIDLLLNIQEKDTTHKAVFREKLNRHLSVYANVICEIVPEMKGYFDDFQENAQFEKERNTGRFYHVLVTLMDTVCSILPVIIIIDDLQWIDSLSFEVLMMLKKLPTPKMMLFVYEVDNWKEKYIFDYSLAAVAQKRINVKPFSHNEMCWFVYSVFENVENENELIEILELKSKGIPLMLNQVIRYLIDSSILLKVRKTWVFKPDAHQIPINFDSVSLILHKFDKLNEKEQRFLKIGSLMDGRLELQIVGELGGYDLQQSKAIVKHLESEGFLVTNFKGDVTFTHDKVQESILNNISNQEKTVLYENLAEEYGVLCEMKSDLLFETAELFFKTSRQDKAVEYSVKAGKYAVVKVAYDLAVRHFRNALFLIEKLNKEAKSTHFDKRAIDLELAEVLMLTGKNDQALEIFNLYRTDTGNIVENCEILYKMGRIYQNSGDFLSSEQFFKKALLQLDFKIPERRFNHSIVTIIEACKQIIHVCLTNHFISRNENFQKRFLVKTLNCYTYSLYFDNLKQSFFTHLKAANIADSLTPSYETYITDIQHVIFLFQLSLKSLALKMLNITELKCRELGNESLLLLIKRVHGYFKFHSGEWKKCESIFLECISEYKYSGDYSGLIFCTKQLFRIQFLKGNLKGGLEYLTSVIDHCNRLKDTHHLSSAYAAQGLMNLLLNNKNAADTDRLMNLPLMHGTPFLTFVQVNIFKLEYKILKGDLKEARRICTCIVPLIIRNGLNNCYTAVAFSLKCELVLKEILLNEQKNSNQSENVFLLKKELKRSIAQLIRYCRKYPAFQGIIYRLSAWNFIFCKKNRLACTNFKKSIAYHHDIDMRYEEAKSLRDYGIALGMINRTGAARDQYDLAYKLFERCEALFECDRLIDMVSQELKKKASEKNLRSSLSSSENTNQIRFDTILQVSSQISEIDEKPVLLNQILTAMIKASGAQYGCIYIKVGDSDMQCVLIRDFNGNEIDESELHISEAVVQRSENSRQVVLDGEVVNGFNTTETGHSRSILCVPLCREHKFLGCVYLGNNNLAGLFSDGAIKTCQILSAQASILLESALLMERYKALNRELNIKVKLQTQDIINKNHQLESTNLRLVESERIKDVLSGTLVHDIKNYAAGIEGNLQYLSRRLEHDVKIKRVMDVVCETCSDIVSLASNLLDIGKMDDGRFIIAPDELDFNFIANLAEKYMTSTLFEEKDIHPRIISPDKKCSIYADVYLLERVLQNLYSNAAKYVSRAGKVELRFEQGDEENVICFFNTGTPIPINERDILFEKYARIENRHSQYSKGLGLFFCKMVMDAHQGKIWVDTDESGNYFRLSFPKKGNRSIVSGEIEAMCLNLA
jgi:serine/threonine protein kinase/signal transduction histidine kinase/tetratricopeptide (TPR) repeat protein